jgi:hypothetical protein
MDVYPAHRLSAPPATKPRPGISRSVLCGRTRPARGSWPPGSVGTSARLSAMSCLHAHRAPPQGHATPASAGDPQHSTHMETTHEPNRSCGHRAPCGRARCPACLRRPPSVVCRRPGPRRAGHNPLVVEARGPGGAEPRRRAVSLLVPAAGCLRQTPPARGGVDVALIPPATWRQGEMQ